ncbi:MAG TPA: CocE/NonD family hydrolase [Candidatus Thermoplasmatota archaeon]|nr:CocE/NonD family hydrolase [Candidatus Thermoplasmatota archaeon]
MTLRALSLSALLLAALFAGCFGSDRDSDGNGGPLVPVQDRHLRPYEVTGPDNVCGKPPCAAEYSHTLVAGRYGILPGQPIDVPVSLPLTEGLPAATGATDMHLGLFLPEIPGCDWTASSLPDACKIPVVADAGPYYASSRGVPELQTEGDSIAEEPAHRLGGFLIENLVPHGYAVAQVSVFGTGDSGHCMDLMGTAEQLGLDAAVTWLGTQPWSNGRVGLTGRSYDGSTPWEAAMFGNPHLSTIVPISGLTSQFDLMYHNGSSESRGAGLLYGLYAAMTVDGDASDSQQALCPDYITGSGEGVKAVATGNPSAADPYWAERIFLDRALANYDGSIYLIHGLQDWNVDPHMAFPAYNQFEAKGNEVKALLGQWNHMYPDRPGEHVNTGEGRGHEAYPESVRYDWAQDMLEWFDHTLKQTGPQPDLHVEVQDNLGSWRIEPTWPPASQRLDVPILASQQAGGETPVVTTAATLHFELGALNPDRDTRFAGMPHLDQWATPTGPGGQLYAQLVDLDQKDESGAPIHLGHAIMDLRYNGGGRSPAPVAPGLPIKVRLEFEPLDVVLPAGHRLGLEYAGLGEDYVSPTVTNPIVLGFGEGQGPDNHLELPIVDPQPSQFFTPPAWSGNVGGAGNGT